MYLWYGQAIFTGETDRDAFVARLRDWFDATVETTAAPSDWWAAGIETQSHANGQNVSGPAFSWSMHVPDEYINDPPEGNGWAGTFSNDIAAAGGECGDSVSGPL